MDKSLMGLPFVEGYGLRFDNGGFIPQEDIYGIDTVEGLVGEDNRRFIGFMQEYDRIHNSLDMILIKGILWEGCKDGGYKPYAKFKNIKYNGLCWWPTRFIIDDDTRIWPVTLNYGDGRMVKTGDIHR